MRLSPLAIFFKQVVLSLHVIGGAQGLLPSAWSRPATSPSRSHSVTATPAAAAAAAAGRGGGSEGAPRMMAADPRPTGLAGRSHPTGTVTREGFLATSALAVAAALAPGFLIEPRPPLSYDVSKYERIFDTSRRSFVPADPTHLILPGAGFADRVVCAGETHTHPLHHRMQFEVIKALDSVTRAKGEPLAIGLEMFYRQQQAALDRYIFKHGDMRVLKVETQWDQTWGFDFNQYAKIFRYARENGIRLVGLNAPQSLLHLINMVGIEGLPPRLSELLPEMDLNNEAHRERFEKAIMGFSQGTWIDPEAMNRMYEAQTLWDEYMAETASRYLERAGGRMVLLAGNGHVQQRDGIPDRVERRTGLKPFTVVPVSVEWTEEGLPDIDHPPGTAFADWVYFTQNEIEPPARGAGSGNN